MTGHHRHPTSTRRARERSSADQRPTKNATPPIAECRQSTCTPIAEPLARPSPAPQGSDAPPGGTASATPSTAVSNQHCTQDDCREQTLLSRCDAAHTGGRRGGPAPIRGAVPPPSGTDFALRAGTRTKSQRKFWLGSRCHPQPRPQTACFPVAISTPRIPTGGVSTVRRFVSTIRAGAVRFGAGNASSPVRRHHRTDPP